MHREDVFGGYSSASTFSLPLMHPNAHHRPFCSRPGAYATDTLSHDEDGGGNDAGLELGGNA